MNDLPRWAHIVIVCLTFFGFLVTLFCAGRILYLQYRAKHKYLKIRPSRKLYLFGLLGYSPILFFTVLQVKRNFYTRENAGWNCAITAAFLSFWIDSSNGRAVESKKWRMLFMLGLLEVAVGVASAYFTNGPKELHYGTENLVWLLAPIYIAREGWGVIRESAKIRESEKQGIAGHPQSH